MIVPALNQKLVALTLSAVGVGLGIFLFFIWKARSDFGVVAGPEPAWTGGASGVVRRAGGESGGQSVGGERAAVRWASPGGVLGGVEPAKEPASNRAERALAPRGVIRNEHILSFYDAKDLAAFVGLARDSGVAVLDEWKFGNTVRIKVRDAAQLEDLLKRGPTPVHSSPNFYAEHPLIPPRAPPGSGYTGFGGRVLDWLGVPAENGEWGAGIKVAVLDTGIGEHPALNGVQISRYSVLPESEPVSPSDIAHGTSVASLLAGRSEEVRGVAPGVELLGIRVIPEEGPGSLFALAQGIVMAADLGARVINLCVGGEGDSYLLRDAVEYARSKGAIIVAAAGNNGSDRVFAPARYEGVLAVSAVDAGGQHVPFANRGDSIDLAAPGVGLNAAWASNSLVQFSGTSASVPLVSGAIAWLLGRHPDWTYADVERALYATCDDAGVVGRDPETGQGVLSVERLIESEKRGIHDVAAGQPYVWYSKESGKGPVVTVLAENRGTEVERRVSLRADIGGYAYEATFFDVKPGERISREYPVALSAMQNGSLLKITCSARIESAGDMRPENNQRGAEFTLVPVR